MRLVPITEILRNIRIFFAYVSKKVRTSAMVFRADNLRIGPTPNYEGLRSKYDFGPRD